MPYISPQDYQSLILRSIEQEEKIKMLMQSLKEVMEIEGGEPDFDSEISVATWQRATRIIQSVEKGK